MSTTRLDRSRQLALVLLAGVGVLWAAHASAQTPPAAPTAPDDTPSVKIGGTIFTDFTYTEAPTSTDAGGTTIHNSAFDVGRAYLNVTGNISHRISFRITPDVRRISGGGTSVDNSLVVRLKYGFGQINMDDWLTKGSWVRVGLQQTPIVDYLEGIYRYRFQGQTFTNKEHYLDSSDFGLSAHVSFPDDYGDVHLGVYNGEYYGGTEVNDQKSFQIRASLRPVPKDKVLKGLRVTGFYLADHYVTDGVRNRFVGNLSFEHERVRAGFEYLAAKDRVSASAPEVHAKGYSIWLTPRTRVGLEGLLRYDSLKPDDDNDARKNTTIVGVSYWFKTQGHAPQAALLADYESVRYDAPLGRADEKRYSLHCLFNF